VREDGRGRLVLGALADATRDVAPELWRRFVAIALDGVRTRRDAAGPLAPGPLDDIALSAMGTSRAYVR
jgi:hypothetical protein